MDMKVICFDIEATDNGEILELSVFSWPENKEIYHSYYKPDKAKEWKTTEKLHHITPQMVADAPRFLRERRKVQEILNSCDLIIGFSIDNDFRYLKSADINIPSDKKVIDVQHLVWVAKGEEFGLKLNSLPSLSKCAQLAGMNFSEEEDAHSATNDTAATLELFDRMLDAYNGGRLEDDLNIKLEKKIEDGQEMIRQENAQGFIRLIPVEAGGYKIKNNAFCEEMIKPIDGEISIRVASRYMAEHDIRKMFERRADKSKMSIYHLRPIDIERFLAYSNTYNAVQEKICRNRYAVKKTKARLDFKIR